MFFLIKDTQELIDNLSDHKNGFDFSLYNNLCKHRGITAMNQSWLEWFVGFSERRATFESFGHTNSLSFRITDGNFINYLKDSLSLSSTPFE